MCGLRVHTWTGNRKKKNNYTVTLGNIERDISRKTGKDGS